MTTAISASTIQNAVDIPAQSHNEAARRATVEYERLLQIVDGIPADKWHEPTDCTLWDVRDMVAHLAGACAGHTSLREFIRQYLRNPLFKEDMEAIDAVNGLQVADRQNRTHAELMTEFRDEAPRAIRVRERLPWLVRHIWLPLGPLGFAPIGYLTDVIYTRDWWMHRADLSRATEQTMHLTPEHDGRLSALVLRDLATKRAKEGLPDTIDLHLTDTIRLMYRFGDAAQPDATVTMNLIEFNRLASERISLNAALEHVDIQGDTSAGQRFLKNCAVPY